MERRLLIIAQNLPAPFDRRVRQALVSRGYRVAVVCPMGKEDLPHEIANRIAMHKYQPCAPRGRRVSFVSGYAYSFLASACLTLTAKRSGRFAVTQAGNLNLRGIFWSIGLAFRAPRGAKPVFGQRDPGPELYSSRFPSRMKLPCIAGDASEREPHKAGIHVISADDSYRDVAVPWSGQPSADLAAARTGPDPERLRSGPADPAHRAGRRYLDGDGEIANWTGEPHGYAWLDPSALPWTTRLDFIQAGRATKVDVPLQAASWGASGARLDRYRIQTEAR